MNDLTNEAKFLLSTMYKRYLDNRKNKVDRRRARSFDSDNDIKEHLMPEWSLSDVQDTLGELEKSKLISYTLGSNHILDVHLTTKAISIMESQFKDKVDSVIDYAVKIKSLIPFI